MNEIEKAEARALVILNEANTKVAKINNDADAEISAYKKSQAGTQEAQTKRHTGHDKTASIKVDKKKQDDAVKFVVGEFKKKFMAA